MKNIFEISCLSRRKWICGKVAAILESAFIKWGETVGNDWKMSIRLELLSFRLRLDVHDCICVEFMLCDRWRQATSDRLSDQHPPVTGHPHHLTTILPTQQATTRNMSCIIQQISLLHFRLKLKYWYVSIKFFFFFNSAERIALHYAIYQQFI